MTPATFCPRKIAPLQKLQKCKCKFALFFFIPSTEFCRQRVNGRTTPTARSVGAPDMSMFSLACWWFGDDTVSQPPHRTKAQYPFFGGTRTLCVAKGRCGIASSACDITQGAFTLTPQQKFCFCCKCLNTGRGYFETGRPCFTCRLHPRHIARGTLLLTS